MRRPGSLVLLAIVMAIVACLPPQRTGSVQRAVVPDVDHAPASYFPIGVFEDGNQMIQVAPFEVMVRHLQSRGLDSVMFTNNYAARHAPLLEVSDRLGANVYMLPAGDLNQSWWPATVPATIATARSVARPIVEAFSPHRSFRGYIVKDEPSLNAIEKVKLMTQAFRELDPDRPAAPILIGTNRVGPIFAAAQPDIMLIDVYPTGYYNPPCNFTMTGYGYGDLDFVSYTRAVAKGRPSGTPLWMILQTHGFGSGGAFSLRPPSKTEVRMQHWLAIGEGATGIFWFIYTSQQGWVGLKDNPAVFAEIGGLAQRTQPLRELLLSLEKTEDRFTIGGPGNPYIGTLANDAASRTFAVAVNRDCQQAQSLTIRSDSLKGSLRDVESGRVYPFGAPIPFEPGDGRIFELVQVRYLPTMRR